MYILSYQLGHLVSRRCAELLPTIVVDSGLSVARATLRMTDDLRTCAVDCSSSGATLVLTIIRGGKVRVPNHTLHHYRVIFRVGIDSPGWDGRMIRCAVTAQLAVTNQRRRSYYVRALDEFMSPSSMAPSRTKPVHAAGVWPASVRRRPLILVFCTRHWRRTTNM